MKDVGPPCKEKRMGKANEVNQPTPPPPTIVVSSVSTLICLRESFLELGHYQITLSTMVAMHYNTGWLHRMLTRDAADSLVQRLDTSSDLPL